MALRTSAFSIPECSDGRSRLAAPDRRLGDTGRDLSSRGSWLGIESVTATVGDPLYNAEAFSRSVDRPVLADMPC